MATINLLPWREERREELKKEFLIILAGFAAVAAAIVFGWKLYLDMEIASQNDRNRYLQQNIKEVNQQVREIANLKQKKQELIERMEVIQSLQGDRPQIVHIFDQIVRTLPDGVFYKSIVRRGKKLTLAGTAESPNRVSSLMRQLEASEWFANPNLSKVTANPRFGEEANDFNLTVAITPPARTTDK